MIEEEKLRDWVCQYLARLLGQSPQTIALDCTLADYGLDSVDSIIMAGELEFAFDLEIDPATFLQYDTIEAMVVALPGLKSGQDSS